MELYHDMEERLARKCEELLTLKVRLALCSCHTNRHTSSGDLSTIPDDSVGDTLTTDGSREQTPARRDSSTTCGDAGDDDQLTADAGMLDDTGRFNSVCSPGEQMLQTLEYMQMNSMNDHVFDDDESPPFLGHRGSMSSSSGCRARDCNQSQMLTQLNRKNRNVFKSTACDAVQDPGNDVTQNGNDCHGQLAQKPKIRQYNSSRNANKRDCYITIRDMKRQKPKSIGYTLDILPSKMLWTARSKIPLPTNGVQSLRECRTSFLPGRRLGDHHGVVTAINKKSTCQATKTINNNNMLPVHYMQNESNKDTAGQEPEHVTNRSTTPPAKTLNYHETSIESGAYENESQPQQIRNQNSCGTNMTCALDVSLRAANKGDQAVRLKCDDAANIPIARNQILELIQHEPSERDVISWKADECAIELRKCSKSYSKFGEYDVLQAAFDDQFKVVPGEKPNHKQSTESTYRIRKHKSSSLHNQVQNRKINSSVQLLNNKCFDGYRHGDLVVKSCGNVSNSATHTAAPHDQSQSSYDICSVKRPGTARPQREHVPSRSSSALAKRPHTASMPVLRLPVWIP